MAGGIHYGVHPTLEAAANELIFASLRGVTSQEAKSDILTPWKEWSRKSREVMASSGTVDPSVRMGIYNRAANTAQPHLNSRDGYYPAQRVPHSEIVHGSFYATNDDWD
jgi:hypothetical protein